MVTSKNKIALFNIASTIILQSLTFISGPIFSGLLGTNNYGIASVYLTWVQFASTVFTLQAAGTVSVARINFPLEDQLKYQSSVLSLATFLYFGFSVLTVIICNFWFSIKLPLVLLGLVHGWGLYCVTFMNLKLTYEFKADKNFVLSITTALCNIGLSLILINAFSLETNYWGRIIGQSGTYGIFGVIICILIIKSGKTICNMQYWKFTLPISIPIVFHLLAIIILNQSDKVMLQCMVNNSAVGIYSLSCTFGAVLSTIWSALNNSWVPFYYEYTRNGQNQEIRKHAKNYIELYTIITIGFILLSKEVFHIYAKESFWDGTDLIPIFSIGYFFTFLYSFPVNYEFYNKKTIIIAVGTTIAAVCNVILNYLLITLFSIQGAVVATTISHGFKFCFHYINAKRITNAGFPFCIMDFIPAVIAIFVSCVFYYLCKDFWAIRWIIGMGLGGYITIKIINRKEIF